MRKFLLLFSLFLTSVAINAQDPVREVKPSAPSSETSNMTSQNQYTGSLTITNSDTETYTAKRFSNNSNGWSTNPMRCGTKTATAVGTAEIYNNQAITEKITKIEVDVTRIKAGTKDALGSNGIKLLVSSSSDFTGASELSFDISGMPSAANEKATFTIEITDAIANGFYDITFDCTAQVTNNGWLAVDAVRYYGELEAGSVTPPAISMNDNSQVIITAAEGDIYYTLNGDVPTSASTPYTDPITITEKTTVKAIAVVGGKESVPTTFNAVPNIVTSLAAFLDLKETTNGIKINCPLTAIYKNGRNLYLTDGDEFILSYNQNNIEIPALKNGQQLSYIKGVFKSQNGLPEIIPSEIGEITDGEAVEPEELGIDELATDQLNRYVSIADVSIVATASANNYTATDADGNTLTIYNSFSNSDYYDVVTVPEGDGFTVIGFTNIYSGKIQITPVAFEGGVPLEHVANPTFDPASGSSINIGDVVTVSSETEGATFYYTDDETEPTTDSDVLANGQYIYTGGTVVLKVLAVKDGMLDSDVMTATYKEYVEGLNEVEFDFSATGNAGTISDSSTIKAGNSTANDQTNNINAVEFISGPVKLYINTAEASTPPKWWSAGEGKEHLRIYKNNVVRVQIVQDNFCLNKVEGVQGGVVTDANFKNVNFTTVKTNLTPAEAEAQAMSRAADTDGEWDNTSKTWTAAEGNKTLWVELTQDKDANAQLQGFKAYYSPAPGLAAIDSVSIDDVNAPVEYFNLQGVRISANNLMPGIYVRRQGSKTIKVLVK